MDEVPPGEPVEKDVGESMSEHRSSDAAFTQEFIGGDFKRAKFGSVKPSELGVLGSLGRGAQADVFKAEWTRSFAACSSTIIIALKRLHSDAPVFRDREALTMVTEHPNLVKCFDLTEHPPYLIITEYCSGGSVFDLLYNSRIELSVRQRVKIMVDVASGMKYLHSQKPCILHRDLKSSNVLLTNPVRSTDTDPFAKVADFGLSRPAGGTKTAALMTVGVGTWRWMAPEVFESETDTAYDQRADIYSFAMLMYELLLRKLPFAEQYAGEGIPDPRIGLHVCMGLRPELAAVPPEVPEELTALMKTGWDSDMDVRPDFEELHEKLARILEDLPSPSPAYF